MDITKSGTLALGVAGVPWQWTRPSGAISMIWVLKLPPEFEAPDPLSRASGPFTNPTDRLGNRSDWVLMLPSEKRSVFSGYLLSVAR